MKYAALCHVAWHCFVLLHVVMVSVCDFNPAGEMLEKNHLLSYLHCSFVVKCLMCLVLCIQASVIHSLYTHSNGVCDTGWSRGTVETLTKILKMCIFYKF